MTIILILFLTIEEKNSECGHEEAPFLRLLDRLQLPHCERDALNRSPTGMKSI